MTTHSQPAFDTIKNEYDIDTLREIVEYGCTSGVANNHIYYSQTVKFYDNNEEEIFDYINDIDEGMLDHIWNNNKHHIEGYKNDMVWCYIELVASQIVSEYEDITCEEMNDTFDDILNSDFGVKHIEVVNV